MYVADSIIIERCDSFLLFSLFYFLLSAPLDVCPFKLIMNHRRITATETPAQKSIYRDRINTNVFELNVVLKDSMHCGIAFDSPGGSLVSTPESSRRCSPQLSKSKRLRVCLYSPGPHNRLNTSPLSPTLEPHRRCGTGSPSQIISASRLSPREFLFVVY